MKQIILKNGSVLAYEKIPGNEENPFFVFLHEGLGCTAMWKDFPARLCQALDFPGILYDRQGYGKSSLFTRPRTIHYLHDYALRELPEVIEALIPGRPFILVGHSDGGSIGLIFAAEKNPLLKALIIEAPHVFVELETKAGVELAVKAFRDGKLQSLEKYHGEKNQALFDAWADTWRSDWFDSWNIEYLLPSITCPVMVVHGEKDRYGTKKQIEAIEKKVKGPFEKLVVEGCGHAPHLEKTEIVIDSAVQFIEKFLK